MSILALLGILFVFIGLSLIFVMIFKSRKLKSLDDGARQIYAQKLIILNFSGVLISILGLMTLFISYTIFK